MKSRIFRKKSKRQRFHISFADSHISPHNLRRHSLIIRASLFLFYQRGQPRHVREVVSWECPYYSRRRQSHTFSIFIPISSCFFRARFFFPIFLQSMRCDAIALCPPLAGYWTQLGRLSQDPRSVYISMCVIRYSSSQYRTLNNRTPLHKFNISHIENEEKIKLIALIQGVVCRHFPRDFRQRFLSWRAKPR